MSPQVQKLQRKLKAKADTRTGENAIARSVVTMTIGERAARARRACILAEAVINSSGEDRSEDDAATILSTRALDPEEAQAAVEVLREAAMDCFWITWLDDKRVLDTPAPSDDEKTAIRLIAKGA